MSIPRYDRDKYYRIMDRTQSNYANQLKRLSKDAKRADFILIYYSLALIVYSLSVKFYPNFFDATWMSYSSIILSAIVLIYSIINSKAGYPERISKLQVALNEVKRLKREVGALPELLAQQSPSSNPSEEADGTSQNSLMIDCAEKYKCTKSPLCSSMMYCSKLEHLKKEYDELVSNTEVRDDLDFYYTICHLCTEYGLDPFTGKQKFPKFKFLRGRKRVDKNNTQDTQTNSDASVLKELRGYIAENSPIIQCIHIWILRFWHFWLYIAPIIIFILGIIFRMIALLDVGVLGACP